jgi:hypothetical protein
MQDSNLTLNVLGFIAIVTIVTIICMALIGGMKYYWDSGTNFIKARCDDGFHAEFVEYPLGCGSHSCDILACVSDT